MSSYLKMLDKARCTVNFCPPNPFADKKAMPANAQVDFIIERLKRFGVKGYSRDYVSRLIHEAI